MTRFYVKIPLNYPHRVTFIRRHDTYDAAMAYHPRESGQVVIVNGQGRILEWNVEDQGPLNGSG